MVTSTISIYEKSRVYPVKQFTPGGFKIYINAIGIDRVIYINGIDRNFGASGWTKNLQMLRISLLCEPITQDTHVRRLPHAYLHMRPYNLYVGQHCQNNI